MDQRSKHTQINTDRRRKEETRWTERRRTKKQVKKRAKLDSRVVFNTFYFSSVVLLG